MPSVGLHLVISLDLFAMKNIWKALEKKYKLRWSAVLLLASLKRNDTQ